MRCHVNLHTNWRANSAVPWKWQWKTTKSTPRGLTLNDIHVSNRPMKCDFGFLAVQFPFPGQPSLFQWVSKDDRLASVADIRFSLIQSFDFALGQLPPPYANEAQCEIISYSRHLPRHCPALLCLKSHWPILRHSPPFSAILGLFIPPSLSSSFILFLSFSFPSLVFPRLVLGRDLPRNPPR